MRPGGRLTIEAQITPAGGFQGSGYVDDRRHDTKRHSSSINPSIKIAVDHISVVVSLRIEVV
jgi:hypothetical protein